MKNLRAKKYCRERGSLAIINPLFIWRIRSVNFLVNHYDCNPAIIIEPTFGKGNFIYSSLDYFTGAKTIYGVELNKSYVWYCKKTLLEKQKFSNRKPALHQT